MTDSKPGTPGLFEFLNDINFRKVNLLREEDADTVAAEKEFEKVRFVINRTLSYFPDTVMQAREGSLLWELPAILHYDFLIGSVPKGRRYSKWAKQIRTDDVEAVSEYFGYNYKRSLEALNLLSETSLSKIKEFLSAKGGLAKTK